MTKKITTKALNHFVTEMKANRLFPMDMSEEPPRNASMLPVWTVVGKTWNEIVMDDERDVLVDFYAPWCDHCKEMESDYTALAKTLAHVDTIRIAKMDAQNNIVNEHAGKITTIPVVRLYPSGDKAKWVDYEGDRTVSLMLSFLAKKATHKFRVAPSEMVAPVPEPTKAELAKMEREQKKLEESKFERDMEKEQNKEQEDKRKQDASEKVRKQQASTEITSADGTVIVLEKMQYQMKKLGVDKISKAKKDEWQKFFAAAQVPFLQCRRSAACLLCRTPM